jgi:HK97 family phage prohead protease
MTGSSATSSSPASVNGVPVGVVAGYLSTWQPDSGGKFGVPDQFMPGAWRRSLAEHRARGMRQVRLKDHHGRTIGGFPVETVREDDRGLFAVGHINLDTELGREVYSLVRQGVLVDFSVGYTAVRDEIKGGVRLIYEAQLWETSIVDEPANPGARILAVGGEEVRDLEREVAASSWASSREQAAVASIVRDLGAMARSLRDGSGSSTKSPSPASEAAALSKIHRDLRAMSNHLRAGDRAAVKSTSPNPARDEAALASMMRDLRGATNALRLDAIRERNAEILARLDAVSRGLRARVA